MRILLISYFFAPQNAMGAVRPTKLAKYLSRMGHEVTVLCSVGMTAATDPTLAQDMSELKDVHIIQEWNPLRKRSQKKAAAAETTAATDASPAFSKAVSRLRARRVVAAVADAVYLFVRSQADKSFRRRATAALKQLNGTYDIVFSTYTPYSVHLVAREAKRRGLAKRWIADFRDEVSMPFAWQAGRKQRYLRMIKRKADMLSAASQDFLRMMGFDDVGHVLSNGFDPEDVPQAFACEPHKELLRMVYCGIFNTGRKGVVERDLTPLFRMLKRLVDEGTLTLQDIKLVYAGQEGALFTMQAKACGLESCVEDHGYVSRDESLRLQRGADVLLVASWHSTEHRGILTGKMFEYMMMDKPILACVSGNIPQTTVKRVLSETGIGFCCEQAGGKQDEDALYAYVQELIKRKKQEKPLLASKNIENVQAYAYPELARTLAKWMAGE